MMGPQINWSAIRLVVFDVDGTLYDQRLMRLRMLREIAGNAISTRSLAVPRILRSFRRFRESIGGEEIEGFEDILIAQVAEMHGVTKERVRAIASEWLNVRPLAHIRACRYPHVAELFAALKQQGKTIGIFSDYPAVDKLCAMELAADYVVAAGDASVGILKPDPRGLTVLMNAAGAKSEETVVVGDRVDRDGEAARRAGVTALIRSNKPLDGWLHFSKFSDPLFAPLYGR
jgi:putative hydrolase of the HAD superfamily